MEILERAQALEANGRDIVHLEVGEPDFDTPIVAVDAGIEALRSGHTHYTHSLGIAPLRDAIARHIEKDYGVAVDAERVVVTTGSSAALVLAFAVLLDPDDEVIVSDPGYACYPNIIRALGGKPKPMPVSAPTDFAYDPVILGEQLTPRTKAIVVNSPSNPTGTLTPPNTLQALAELGPTVVSDEIYHGLVYEGSAHSILEFTSDAFVVGGFSKRYAMTGWRLGYMVCPADVVRQVQALAQNLFISPPDFGQWAALAALDSSDDIENMRREFDVRRLWLVDALARIGLPVPARPQGAFYIWADASRYTNDSAAFAVDLLERASVAVAPGIDFGSSGEGFLRLSYATSLDRIREGVRRMGEYLSTISR
jgi:aspartate/methionine/tyrosine aminotransferase